MRNAVIAVLLLVLVGTAAVGIGGYAYNMGVAQGMSDSGKVVVPGPGAPPFVYGNPYRFYRPFGFGLGPLGCLFPLLMFGLFFFLIRSFFWHGRGWGGMRGPGRGPAMFEEWHRQAHGTPSGEPSAPQPKA